jgi:hypothetical protein
MSTTDELIVVDSASRDADAIAAIASILRIGEQLPRGHVVVRKENPGWKPEILLSWFPAKLVGR